jgi:hypothetical protein
MQAGAPAHSKPAVGRQVPGAPPGSASSPGHGGAYATNMQVNLGTGIITLCLAQHAGYPNGVEGKKTQPAFQKAAAALAPKH